jgi:peptide/nickel transport system ATP-binding protein
VSASSGALLSVRDLTVTFRTRTGTVQALENVTFEVGSNEMVGMVGESGSGKSVTAFAVMGLLDRAARIASGEALFAGRDLLRLPPGQLDELRGRDLSLVFQNPRTALNPIRPIGLQIADVIARHAPARKRVVRQRVLEALRQVRIPDPEHRMGAFPHELSGGMCQRVGIAMALACRPKLLIADEPTTGLDVTTQAVVMDLFRDAVRAQRASAILITHDLALASEYCDRVVVMHAGHVVEIAPVAEVFARPRHPYTAKLLRTVPSAVGSLAELRPIEGALPDLRRSDLPACRFSERCERREAICEPRPLRLSPCGERHAVACRIPL